MLEPEVTRNFSNIDPVYKFWYFDRHGFLCSFWFFKTLHWNIYFDYRVFWCLLRLYSSLTFPLFWSCLWGLWSRGLGAGAVLKCCSRELYIPDFQLYANAGETPPGAPKIVWERTVGAGCWTWEPTDRLKGSAQGISGDLEAALTWFATEAIFQYWSFKSSLAQSPHQPHCPHLQ